MVTLVFRANYGYYSSEGQVSCLWRPQLEPEAKEAPRLGVMPPKKVRHPTTTGSHPAIRIQSDRPWPPKLERHNQVNIVADPLDGISAVTHSLQERIQPKSGADVLAAIISGRQAWPDKYLHLGDVFPRPRGEAGFLLTYIDARNVRRCRYDWTVRVDGTRLA